MRKFICTVTSSAVLFSVVSCNIFAPFNTYTSDADYIEEAQRCLHAGDFSCASANYAKVSSVSIKNEKLCVTGLAQAGLTLVNLITELSGGGDDMLVQLANALVPWTEDKATAAQTALTYCEDYAATADNPDTGALLRSVSLIMHCANLISKTDLYLGTAEADTTCTTAGNNSGTITAADVSSNSLGTIGGGDTGMCNADVTSCRDDIIALGSSGLGGSSLSGLQESYESVPDELKDSGAAAAAVRSAIRNMF